MGLVHRTYQQRAYASAAGYDRLDFIMLNCARLYNAALEEWRAAYRHKGLIHDNDNCRPVASSGNDASFNKFPRRHINTYKRFFVSYKRKLAPYGHTA